MEGTELYYKTGHIPVSHLLTSHTYHLSLALLPTCKFTFDLVNLFLNLLVQIYYEIV